MANLDRAVSAGLTDAAAAAAVAWINSREPAGSPRTRQLETELQKLAASAAGVRLTGHESYRVGLTGGRAEALSTIITTAARAYAHRTKRLPHLVVCGAARGPAARCAKALEDEGAADVTILAPPEEGTLDPETFGAALRGNTCVAVVSAANLLTGELCDLGPFGEAAARARCPLHVDASLVVGREEFSAAAVGAASFSFEFGPIGGDDGCGVLGVSHRLVEGYQLGDLVHGRSPPGGAAMAASLAALREAVGRRRRIRKAAKRAAATARGLLGSALGSRVAWLGDAKNALPGFVAFEVRGADLRGAELRERLGSAGVHVGPDAEGRVADERRCVVRLAFWDGGDEGRVAEVARHATSRGA